MNFEIALKIASEAHKGQFDKGGKEYILHPLRLSEKFSDEKRKIIAVLHDTIEDTYITLDMLSASGFDGEIIEAIIALTRKKGESYEDFILRIKANQLAREVKIEDLKDNMNLDRIESPCKNDYKRLRKYQKSLMILTTDNY